MEQINATKELGSHLMYFTGKTVADSIAAALAWGKARGVTMGRYYVQEMDNRSILADYAVTI